MQGLYAKSYKMLMKEIRENLNKQIDQPCSQSGRFHIVKMLIILGLLIPIKLQATFFVDIHKEILNLCGKLKELGYLKQFITRRKNLEDFLNPAQFKYSSAVLSKGQIHRLMQQHRHSRTGPPQVSQWLWTKVQQ